MTSLTKSKAGALATLEPGLRILADGILSQPNGQAFLRAIFTFLAGQSNKGTRRVYTFSLMQFYRWYRWKLGRCPTPDQVTRAEALSYAEWLRDNEDGLEELVIEEDPSKRDELAIYLHVKSSRGSTRNEMIHTVGSIDRVNAALKWLLKTSRLKKIGNKYFIRLPRKAPPGPGRSSTMVLRLGALSALWRHLIEDAGENKDASDGLLKFNIWSLPTRTAAKQSPSHKKTARQSKTPSTDLFLRLLSTTFRGNDINSAIALARRAEDWRPNLHHPEQQPALTKPVRANRTPLIDLRDRALLLLLAYSGLRADEVAQVRRSVLASSPVVITVTGKGGKVRSLRLPDAAIEALRELHSGIAREAATRNRPGTLLQLLVHHSAPLLPNIRWRRKPEGDTSHVYPGNITGMSPSAITRAMRERALQMGLCAGMPEWARIHPHGLRHLAAKSALTRGVPLPVIQAVLGHTNLGTTGQYVEEHDPSKLSLVPEG